MVYTNIDRLIEIGQGGPSVPDVAWSEAVAGISGWLASRGDESDAPARGSAGPVHSAGDPTLAGASGRSPPGIRDSPGSRRDAGQATSLQSQYCRALGDATVKEFRTSMCRSVSLLNSVERIEETFLEGLRGRLDPSYTRTSFRAASTGSSRPGAPPFPMHRALAGVGPMPPESPCTSGDEPILSRPVSPDDDAFDPAMEIPLRVLDVRLP